MHWLQIVLGEWSESNHYALRRPKDNNVRICQCVQPPVVEASLDLYLIYGVLIVNASLVLISKGELAIIPK